MGKGRGARRVGDVLARGHACAQLGATLHVVMGEWKGGGQRTKQVAGECVCERAGMCAGMAGFRRVAHEPRVSRIRLQLSLMWPGGLACSAVAMHLHCSYSAFDVAWHEVLDDGCRLSHNTLRALHKCRLSHFPRTEGCMGAGAHMFPHVWRHAREHQ
eukprot:364326-Chlamydomonas_euryale.AAC.5